MRQAQVIVRLSAEQSVRDQLEEFADQFDTLVCGHTPYNVEQLEPLLDYESDLLDKVLAAHLELAEDAVTSNRVLGEGRPDYLEAQEHLEEVNRIRDALKEGRFVKLP